MKPRVADAAVHAAAEASGATEETLRNMPDSEDDRASELCVPGSKRCVPDSEEDGEFSLNDHAATSVQDDSLVVRSTC